MYLTRKLGKEDYMKKEEILEKARKENKNKDYALIEEENKASLGLAEKLGFHRTEILAGKKEKAWIP